MITKAYKVLTHDYKSPIQGRDPIFDGKLPFSLPRVEVDTDKSECAAGWNACKEGSTALKLAGLWPNGYPCRLYKVETSAKVIERGDKLRASTWTLVEECDIKPHIEDLSKPFGDYKDLMVNEQLLWYEALGRPLRNRTKVIAGLKQALAIRDLNWKLKEFKSVRDAWNACNAWDAEDAWNARDAWNAEDALNALNAWYAWYARDAWRARDARDALVHTYASCMNWINSDPAKYTIGAQDAYKNGLSVIIPVAPETLGWVMVK